MNQLDLYRPVLLERARTDAARLAAARTAAWDTDPGNTGSAHTMFNAYGYHYAYTEWSRAEERLRQLTPRPTPEPIIADAVAALVVSDDPEPENDTAPDPERAWAVFARRWPQSLQATGLRAHLAVVLQGVGVPSHERLRLHKPVSGTFQAMANWARIEMAHMNTKSGHPSIWLPPREPMPQALIDLMKPVEPKKPKRNKRAS
jgi:hypothetical protein